MGGLDGLTGGLGDHVLDVRAGNLGDGVAMFDLNGDDFDGGVVDAVLGGDLAASVLHSGHSRVGNSVSNGGDGGVGSGETTIGEELGISVGISFSLHNVKGGRSVTDGVDDILAHLLVLDLLGVDGLLRAHVLGGWRAGLGDQDLVFNLAVGGGGNKGGGSIGSGSKELRVSIRISCGGSMGGNGEEENGKKLIHDEIVLYFPRECIELK